MMGIEKVLKGSWSEQARVFQRPGPASRMQGRKKRLLKGKECGLEFVPKELEGGRVAEYGNKTRLGTIQP
jgi:hypothetical protein